MYHIYMFWKVETSDVYICIYKLLSVLYVLLKPQLIVMYYMYVGDTVQCMHPYRIITGMSFSVWFLLFLCATSPLLLYSESIQPILITIFIILHHFLPLAHFQLLTVLCDHPYVSKMHLHGSISFREIVSVSYYR